MKKIIITLAWWSCITLAVLLLFSGSFFALPVIVFLGTLSRINGRAWRTFYRTSYRACTRMFK